MDAFGRTARIPGAPAISRNDPIEAPSPKQRVATGHLTYCIVS